MSGYLDPNYEWVEMTRLGDVEPSFIRGRKKACPHLRRVRVESTVEPHEVVAQLCLECDAQLDAK